MSDITLTSAMRSNLQSLQDIDRLTSITQNRLATGKKVNSALDNPSNYFAAQLHISRANALQSRKDAIVEAVQTIKAANAGTEKISKLVDAARGILSQARSTTDATALTNLSTQYKELLTQIDNVVTDSGYKGINLLDSGSISVAFNEDNTTNMSVTGFAADSTGLSLTSPADGTAIDTSGEIDALEAELTAAKAYLQTNAATLSSSLTVLEVRSSFIDDMTNVLKTGADNLTLADMNEESANMLSLQVRQQMATTSLSLASQAMQSVLRLF